MADAVNHAVAVLMQVAGDDQPNRRGAEFREQHLPRRPVQAAGGRLRLTCILEEKRLVQEQRHRPPGRGGEFRVQPCRLGRLRRQARSEQLRVHADQMPRPEIQRPAVGAKGRVPARQPGLVHELFVVLARRLVADIVVAGQRQHARPKARERGRRERDLGVAVRAVDAQVAADDHCGRRHRVDGIARQHPVDPDPGPVRSAPVADARFLLGASGHGATGWHRGLPAIGRPVSRAGMRRSRDAAVTPRECGKSVSPVA
jgi:hypothetical protein